MTPKETKAYRAAMVRIIENAGFVLVNANSTPLVLVESEVIRVGKNAPSIVAAHLTRLIKQRAGIWTRYNNSGPFDDAGLKACDDRCDALQTTVDAILALFGIAANWGVGLYPVYTVNGCSEHNLVRAIRESFHGKATL